MPNLKAGSPRTLESDAELRHGGSVRHQFPPFRRAGFVITMLASELLRPAAARQRLRRWRCGRQPAMPELERDRKGAEICRSNEHCYWAWRWQVLLGS